MKDDAQRLDVEGGRVSAEAVQIARDGELLLPRLDLCISIVNNYRVKIDAARHKASLLKNMTLDEMKVGLIGDSQAAPLLSNDLMKVQRFLLSNNYSNVFVTVLVPFQGTQQQFGRIEESGAEGCAALRSIGRPTALIGANYSTAKYYIRKIICGRIGAFGI